MREVVNKYGRGLQLPTQHRGGGSPVDDRITPINTALYPPSWCIKGVVVVVKLGPGRGLFGLVAILA